MTTPWTPKPVKRVAVVGMGTMGMQIAALSACAGFETQVYDGLPGAVDRALKRLAEDVIPGIVDTGMNPIPTTTDASLARLIPKSTLEEAVADVELVIEAVREDIDVKLEIFAELSRLAPEAILATGSSSLLSRPLAAVVENPERLLNMHFFAPVWVRTMVELMTCGQTSELVFDEATKVGKAMGIVVACVQGESKGFIINRVWRAIKRESLRVVDEGHATPEDVDRLFMLFFEAKRAPFSTMDLVGLDVVADIERSYHAVATDPADVPIKLLTDKVTAGELGEKTGSGFYTYPNPSYTRPNFLHPDNPE